jgi:hypothetical protein
MKELKFEDLSVGTKVYDKDFDCIGTVTECSDIHNVKVKFEDGMGLYCLQESCKEEKEGTANGQPVIFTIINTDKLYSVEQGSTTTVTKSAGDASPVPNG